MLASSWLAAVNASDAFSVKSKNSPVPNEGTPASLNAIVAVELSAAVKVIEVILDSASSAASPVSPPPFNSPSPNVSNSTRVY